MIQHCNLCDSLARPSVIAQRLSVAKRCLTTSRTCPARMRTKNWHNHGSTRCQSAQRTHEAPPSPQHSRPAPEDAPSELLPVKFPISWPLSRREAVLATASLTISLRWLHPQQASASITTLSQQPRSSLPRGLTPPLEEPIKLQIAHVQRLTQQAVDAAATGDYEQVRWTIGPGKQHCCCCS